MEKEHNTDSKLYELLPCNDGAQSKALPIRKKRVLIGRSQTCDIVIASPEVTAIHAVLENVGDDFKIYDMNSTNGTFVNGSKVVSEKVRLGDKLSFGRQEFELKLYNKDEVVSAPLEMLGSDAPEATNDKVAPKLPKALKENDEDSNVKLDQEPEPQLPRVSYPLAKDPNAEFSEYIFEDVDTLYPIFDYDIKAKSIEVIILFQDKIYSVDYLPLRTGVIHLVGNLPKSSDISYAYLGEGDKVPFIDIQEKGVRVKALSGYDILSLNEDKGETSGTISLKDDDILRFSNGDLQIYVRGSEAPPYVERAPILRRDPLFLKALGISFLLVFLVLSGLYSWDIDEDLEKDKIPERIATILYKKEPKKPLPKKPIKPKVPLKKDMKKAPKAASNKSTTTVKEQSVSNKRPVKGKNPGDKKTGVKKVPKLAKPNKGKKNNLKKRVVKPTNRPGGKAKRTPRSKSIKRGKIAKGRQDVYKAADFAPTLNSLMARSGGTKAVGVAVSSSDEGTTSIAQGGEGATLKNARVSNNSGNLDGLPGGAIDGGRGGADIVGKKTAYLAPGLPYKMVVLGGMDPDIIDKIIRDNIPQFYSCYQSELEVRNRSFSGIVNINFTIGASGHVTKAAASAKTGNLPSKVRACVVKVTRRMEFPSPPGGGIVEVSRPLNFSNKKR